MSTPTPWPRFDWNRRADVAALLERVREVAMLARRFETALEECGEADELDIGQLSDVLGRWDEHAGEVFRYTGLGEAKEIPADQAPALFTELQEQYGALCELRLEMVAKLSPEAAAALLAREKTVEVDPSLLDPPPDGPMPELEPPEPIDGPADIDLLGGGEVEWSVPKRLPVTADEVRSRQVAENKVLPDKLTLAALLANQPSDWVTTIYETLGIEDDGAELTLGSRSAKQRGAIHRFLNDPDSLQNLVIALGNEERQLLAELLAAGGAAPYRQVTDKWGLDEADGFYWRERPPSCALAWLRRNGLAYVGSRGYRLLVVVAADLAQRLEQMLTGADAGEGG